MKFSKDQLTGSQTVAADSFGNSLIVAPHPDDETLGCGGTAALLLQQGLKVNFVFVSDGTMSHPNSRKFPASQLRELRETEAVEAVTILGASKSETEFLAYPDRAVQGFQSPFFESAVRIFASRLMRIKPDTVFLPWKNDPHPDHRATWQIVSEAVRRLVDRPRLVQYPIWLWEMGEPQDLEQIGKMDVFCVDISKTLKIKQEALGAHKSQVSDLIDDDPEGFRLSAAVLENFAHDREIFFEFKPDI